MYGTYDEAISILLLHSNNCRSHQGNNRELSIYRFGDDQSIVWDRSMHDVRFGLTRMSVAPFPIKELACKTHIVPMYGVSAASLFYLHHLRSCAANAMGAKGAPLNANAPVWSSHLLKFSMQNVNVCVVV